MEEGDDVNPEIYIHAPTVTVSLLQRAACVVGVASKDLPGETVFFPKKDLGETQPVNLEGRVSLRDLADLISYIADMLEV